MSTSPDKTLAAGRQRRREFKHTIFSAKTTIHGRICIIVGRCSSSVIAQLSYVTSLAHCSVHMLSHTCMYNKLHMQVSPTHLLDWLQTKFEDPSSIVLPSFWWLCSGTTWSTCACECEESSIIILHILLVYQTWSRQYTTHTGKDDYNYYNREPLKPTTHI